MNRDVCKCQKLPIRASGFMILAFIMTAFVACSFEPAWKTQRKTTVSVSFALPASASATGSGAGRALASDSGYLYAQTGQTAADATVYGPYQVSSGKTLKIVDILPGNYSWFSLLYSPVVLPDASAFPVTELGLEGFAASVLERVAADPSLSMRLSCAAIEEFPVIEGRENSLAATLVPVTDATVNGSVSLAIPGSATARVQRFARLEPGFAASSFVIKALSDSDSASYSLASWALYNSKGAYLEGASPALPLSTTATAEIAITRPADSVYYLSLSFTAPALSVIAALPPDPVEPGPAPEASSFVIGTGAANVSELAQTLTLELEPSENGIVSAEFTGLMFSAMTATLDGAALSVSEAAGVVTFGSTVYSGGTLVLSGASLPNVNGSHTITCKLTDAASLSSPLYEQTVILDTLAPPAPTSLTLAGGTSATSLSSVPLSCVLPASVAGIKTVQITGADTAALTGVTLDGSAVTYSVSVGSVVLAVPVTSGGTLAVQGVGLLSDATYTVGVSLIDAVGRIGSQAVTSIIRDTTSPNATLFAVNGSVPTNTSSVGCQLVVAETGSGLSRIEFAGDVSSLSGASVYIGGSMVASSVVGLAVDLAMPVSGSSLSVNVNGIMLAGADGVKNVTCTVVDDLGHVSAQITAPVRLDTAVPVLSALLVNGGNPTLSSSVYASFTAQDNGTGLSQIVFGGDVSSLSSASVMINASPVGVSVSGLTLTLDAPVSGSGLSVTVSGITLAGADGVKTLSCSLVDGAGLVSNMTDGSITVDMMSPTVSGFSLNGGFPVNTLPVNGSFTATDTGTGIREISFTGDVNSISGMTLTVDSMPVTFTIAGLTATLDSPVTGTSLNFMVNGIALVPSDGNKVVNFTLTDTVGHVSGTASSSVTLDATAPSVSGFVINGGLPTATNINSCTLTASDAAGFDTITFSGDVMSLSSPTVLVDGSPVGSSFAGLVITLGSPSTGGAITVNGVYVTPGDGVKTVYCTLTDAAGNLSTQVSAILTLDATAPSAPTLAYSGAPYFIDGITVYVAGTNITITPMSTDSGSGVQGYSLDSNAGPWTSILNVMVDGSPHVVWVRDMVGNLASVNFTPYQDMTAPMFVSANGMHPSLMTDSAESGSGIATVEVFYYPTQNTSTDTFANYSMWTYSSLGISSLVSGNMYSTTTGVVTQTANNYVYFRVQMTDRVGNMGVNYFWRFYDGSNYTYSGPNP